MSNHAMRRWVGLGCWVLAGLGVGCGVGPPHEFRGRSAESFGSSSAAAAALLIPENTRLHHGEGASPIRAQTLADEAVNRLNYTGESYAGPARIFFAPGRWHWRLEVRTDDGRVDAPVDAVFEAGGRYLIEIDESDDNFEWSLTRLSPQSYRRLYER